MPCTTILVGKKASYDGSTMMARNEDSSAGEFESKKFIVVNPEDQPRHYVSVISKVEIDLPDDPMRYTAMPNALPHEGIWGEAGVNELNIAMSETETLTSNPRVLGADPLVKEGIGEEDMLTLVLPYIRSAREGVERLGSLLETYGTYEMNGIGFQDADEIWWFETVGGHHWMARRVPDDCYAVIPNQLGLDLLDLEDAFGEQKEYMCSADMREFIKDNHLNLSMEGDGVLIDPRETFGSHSDSDHSYNTPRAWYMEKCLNPHTFVWEGEDADYGPESDDIPWCLVPEHKVTVEDIKYVLSSYYQGTKYNPYLKYGDRSEAGRYRPVGINRNNFVTITQLRGYMPSDIMAVQWMACGSNAFNCMIPFYANVTRTPEYLANTSATVTTENFYWVNRIIGALVDAHYSECMVFAERYETKMLSFGHSVLKKTDASVPADRDIHSWLEEVNDETAGILKQETYALLDEVLLAASNDMKNAYSRSDA